MKPYHLVFRVRHKYFVDIVAGTKKIEYRKASEFWRKRVLHAVGNVKVTPLLPVGVEVENVTGVFICGKDIHRRNISKIDYIMTPRWFSETGKHDVNTETCFAFHLGDVVTKWD